MQGQNEVAHAQNTSYIVFWRPQGKNELEGVLVQNFEGEITCEIDLCGHTHYLLNING